MQRWRAILRASLALLLCLICLSHPVQGYAATSDGDSRSHWQFSKSIELEPQATYQELYLDEEVYGQATEDLRDLRIVNGKGEFVPFYIESQTQTSEKHKVTYSSELMDTAKKGTNSIFDFKIIPVQDNIDIQGNRLVFELPSEPFLKHVQVLGGYDGHAWKLLGKGDLYYTEGLEQNYIELGATYKFNHYRLIVENNMENLQFSDLSLIQNTEETKTMNFQRQQTPEFEIIQEPKETQILIDNGNRLKISKVILDSEGNFTRTYAMFDDDGSRIGTEGNELYRLDFKDARIADTDIVTQATVNSPEFKIVIYNRDDAPIAISGIRIEYLVNKLVFAAGGEEPYQLLYGNLTASAPQYDLINFKAHIESSDVAMAKLGAEIAASKETGESLSKVKWFQSRLGFNVIIIAVSLLLILVLIRKLNRK